MMDSICLLYHSLCICFSHCSSHYENTLPFLYPWHLCRGLYSFRLSIRLCIRSCVHSFVPPSVTLMEFMSKFYIKVSLNWYISLTANQKALIFWPCVPAFLPCIRDEGQYDLYFMFELFCLDQRNTKIDLIKFI